MIQRYLRGDSPSLQAQGRSMASRHTITTPKPPKTSGHQTDKNKKSTTQATSSDGNKKSTR
jgi:hypothetical protein